ncbi:MAG: DNA polymerase III subunit beta [Erysipelotrichaceae bacterium]|nr:DNA polymerase III subunit beta [Erysipelotrichaceae bacterium]
MQFTINRRIFLEKLNILSKAISNSVPLPILTSVKLTVTNDEITMISSDGNISIKTIINDMNDFKVTDEGSVCLDFRKLIDCVKKSDTNILGIEVIDGSLVEISYDKVKLRINGAADSEYPLINFDESRDYFNIRTSDLLSIINMTSFAVATSDNRPALKGINFKNENKKLVAVATDSYRLAKKEIDLDFEKDFNIVVPKNILNDVASIISTQEFVSIFLSNQKIYFIIDNNIIQALLIDDVYPDTSRIIPSEFTNTLTIDSYKLLKSIDRAQYVKSDGKSLIKMSINQEEIQISSRSSDNESTSEYLTYKEFSGDDLVISCNSDYLMSAIKALNCDEVKINFVGALRPFIIQNEADPNSLQLVSPVRTYE